MIGCDDSNEVNLILNTVVLLRDGAGIKVDPKDIRSAPWVKRKGPVKQRVDYLSIEP